MNSRRTARNLTIALWIAVAASFLAWILVGYSWPLCVAAVIVLATPLSGLARGRRYTYAWSTLFATPYLVFALTELLVNPAARWVAGLSVVLVFAWFCSMVFFLRTPRGHPE